MKKLILVSMLVVLMACPAWSADEWLKTRPALTGDQWTAWPAASQANNNSLDRLLANYRQGMVLAYSSATTVTVSAGEVMCSNTAGTARKMRQNTASTNVTFTDIDTGSEESSKTYYVYANCDADATTATFKVSLSSTAPTSVTSYRRLGSFYNDSSSNISISPLTNDGNYYAPGNGDWTAKTLGVVYQALTDGDAYVYTSGGGDRQYYGYTDSASSPSTVKLAFSTYPDGSEAVAQHFHVKKGDYWQITYSGGSGTAVVSWLPSGN